MAAVTKNIRFTTAVMKLAIRQPVMVAKMLTSMAVMTNNRFSIGVGISPWKEDFEIAQIPWEKRGKRMDEIIAIIRGLQTGEYFGFEGDIFNVPAIKLCPTPSQPIPIITGGHAEAALKRAARSGDGWVAAGGSLEDLERMIKRIHELRKEYQRDHLPFEIHTNSDQAYSPEGIEKLEAIGVTDITVAFRNIYKKEADDKTLEEKIGMMSWYADNVIKASR
jgi:alkanesulfonate monooxygenase SsuD/methylene tetrahydromethanopterin reductase-like flavin-dependent oxidoreductase (luciferase family)